MQHETLHTVLLNVTWAILAFNVIMVVIKFYNVYKYIDSPQEAQDMLHGIERRWPVIHNLVAILAIIITFLFVY